VPYAEQVEFCGLDGTKLVFQESDLLLGKSVERYRILDVVGDGGMARVYRARHETLDREYALKVLYGEVASNKTLAERFRREAKTMSKISHENVVSVVDYGTTTAGLTFLSMELIAGETLRTAIKRLGRIPPPRAAAIARQIALGLSAAHQLGFVHRDLKPSNVMLVPREGDEVVKLLDFGLVRAAEIDHEVGFLTKTGQFVGTPIYMAPEQIIGGDVDAKADLYGLGVVLFEMLEGHPPFTAKKLSEIRKKHLEAPPPRARPARGLEHLAMDLLAKSPEARPEGTAEVIARIDAIDFSGFEFGASAGAEVPSFVPEPLLVTNAEPRLASSIGSAEEGALDLSSAVPAASKRWILPAGLLAAAAGALGIYLSREPRIDPPAPSPPALASLARPVAAPPPPPPQVETPRLVEPPSAPARAAAPAAKPKRSDRAVRSAAKQRGLTFEDLARHPDTKRPFAAWSRAKRDDALKAELLHAIETARIDHAFLQKKLDAINRRLSEASSKVPLTELRDLEDRYLQLVQAVRPGVEAAEAERLLQEVQKLLRDIGSATTLSAR
jgi:serine/threonine-protein kinase